MLQDGASSASEGAQMTSPLTRERRHSRRDGECGHSDAMTFGCVRGEDSGIVHGARDVRLRVRRGEEQSARDEHACNREERERSGARMVHAKKFSARVMSGQCDA